MSGVKEIFFNAKGEELLQSLGVSQWSYTEQSKAASYDNFELWLSQKEKGKLSYLEGERGEKRKDIRLFFSSFASSLVFLFSYSEQKQWMNQRDAKGVAAYALGFQGQDYHYVLKDRLEKIVLFLEQELGAFNWRLSIDKEPVLERDLAYRAGLGWFGKNSMLLNRSEGSYFLIASILLDKKLGLKTPALEADHCGECRRCLDACPTQAITEHRNLLAQQCISTFTIETFKEEPEPEGFDESYYFGCDICQDICPWNTKALKQTKEHLHQGLVYEFFLKRETDQIINDLSSMSNRAYKKMFRGTALERPGRIGMIKNLKAIARRRQNDNSHLGD